MSRSAEELYERVFGFSAADDAAFARFCRRALPRPRAGRRPRVLCVGAGHGRTDLPLLRALGVPLDAVLLEPSARFRARLRTRLRSARLPAGSRVRVAAGTLEAFLARDRGPLDAAYAGVSLQHLARPAASVAALAARLSPGGLLVLAASEGQGAWVSRPPAGRAGPRHRRWRALWAAWHAALPPRRLPALPPHDHAALAPVLRRAGLSPAGPAAGRVFRWERTVGARDLADALALAGRGGWKGVVTGLSPAIAAAARRAVAARLTAEGPWAERRPASCLNALRVRVWRKRP